MTIPVVLFGLGPIGCRLGSRLLTRPDLQIVAAVDIDPQKAGAKLGELLGDPAATDVIITDDMEAALAGGDGRGVVVHATGSRLVQVAPQFDAIARHRWNTVSTCEELVNPRLASLELAAELDRTARDAGVTLLGSGINPGFLLDTLVLVLSGACARVDAVRVTRVVNTDQRREPLQRKAGVGMTVEAFRSLAERNGIGHVGLSQSAHLVAEHLGLAPTDYRETIEPVVAKERTETGLGTVEAGGVLGQHQTATVLSGDRPVVSYTQVMAAGADSVDIIEIDGEPDIRQRIEGGINGDIGTEAVIANLVGPVAEARPGLLTMPELLPFHCAAR